MHRPKRTTNNEQPTTKMNYDPKRSERLKLLNGIRKGRISLSAIYNDWPVKSFYVYSEVPGFVLNGSLYPQPVDPETFNKMLFTWPKLDLKLLETEKEEVLQRIKGYLSEGKYGFLWDILPKRVRKVWRKEKAMKQQEKEKAEKQKQKEKERKEEETRQKQKEIAERWATLHPLNQEWGIPPPPAIVSVAGDVTKYDPAIEEWVDQYRPYMYERDGFIFRKMNMVRHDKMYERSYTDLPFPSDHGHGIGIHVPRIPVCEDTNQGMNAESPTNETRTGELPARTEMVPAPKNDFHSGGHSGELLYARNDDKPTAAEIEPPPPRKIYKVSDIDFKESNREIQKIARAMETWLPPREKDKKMWEEANAIIAELRNQKHTMWKFESAAADEI